MEHIQGTQKASKFAPQDIDFISSMPDIVVTHILDRLPLQYAMRTSALSRNWRVKWTMLSRLVFDEEFYYYLYDIKHNKDYGRIISRLLLNLKGAITKFVLYINDLSKCNDEDIAHWILFLSRKGVKDLIIRNVDVEPIKLSTFLFSCLELKHLELFNCSLVPSSAFHGFPNLLSLWLCKVQFEHWNFGEFFTQCPVLEILNLYNPIFEGRLRLVDVAKLTNLKSLTLYLSIFENAVITSSSCIFEFLGLLPKLQTLHLDFAGCMSFTEDGATKRHSSTFSCLKTLKLSKIDLTRVIMASFALEIISSSPNLQTLEIIADRQDGPYATCYLELEKMEFLHLRNVVFTALKGLENEVSLIEYLLACSPFLKKIVIRPHLILKSEGKLKFAKKLLELHRASTVAEINFL